MKSSQLIVICFAASAGACGSESARLPSDINGTGGAAGQPGSGAGSGGNGGGGAAGGGVSGSGGAAAHPPGGSGGAGAGHAAAGAPRGTPPSVHRLPSAGEKWP